MSSHYDGNLSCYVGYLSVPKKISILTEMGRAVNMEKKQSTVVKSISFSYLSSLSQV